jgi:hypothetical protein
MDDTCGWDRTRVPRSALHSLERFHVFGMGQAMRQNGALESHHRAFPVKRLLNLVADAQKLR